jgi:hypothetical protein
MPELWTQHRQPYQPSGWADRRAGERSQRVCSQPLRAGKGTGNAPEKRRKEIEMNAVELYDLAEISPETMDLQPVIGRTLLSDGVFAFWVDSECIATADQNETYEAWCLRANAESA